MFYQLVGSFLLVIFISLKSYAIGQMDICESNESSGFCLFSSFIMYDDDTVYFHCSTKKSNRVEMESNDLLISGFAGSRATSEGTLRLIGKDAMKTLNTSYFKVQSNPFSTNRPKLLFFADEDIVCEIGKGKNRRLIDGQMD